MSMGEESIQKNNKVSAHSNHRFVTLDGLRGIAALAVLAFHILQRIGSAAPATAALAVDFFYVLSGFVIAFAYEDGLRKRSLSLSKFTAVRIVRLYPLLLLGVAMGSVLALGAAVFQDSITLTEWFSITVLAVLLLPSFVIPEWSTAYPLNGAAWSLTFEMFMNIVYAIIAPLLSTRLLVGIVLVGAAALFSMSYEYGQILGGNDQGNFWLGFPRVVYPFLVGVLLFRFRPRFVLPGIYAVLLSAILGLVLMSGIRPNDFSDFFLVTIVFPVVVYFGAAVQVSNKIGVLMLILGELSYPVYILQNPILRVFLELEEILETSGLMSVLMGVAQATIVIGFSWVMSRHFDLPVRKWLRAKIATIRPAQARNQV